MLALALVSAGAAAWAAGASAAEAATTDPGAPGRFGRQGSVSLSVERLFGLSHASQSSGPSTTTVSLMGSSGLELGVAPYGVPRIGVDGFLGHGLSLGLAGLFAVVDQNSTTVTVLGLNPRVGYAVHASDGLSLWPRLGLSYVNIGASSNQPFTQGQSAYALAATIELQVVVTPLPRVGFLVAPTFDVGLAGTNSDKVTQIGLQAGLMAWF